ncbi:MAG: phytanoyl-CoA dioxygenase family protein [Alphaproteobacteria bacterium]|nr:phytanoyl-CoA dioxygenase family protein [Alphaproteobacteria bacterium]
MLNFWNDNGYLIIEDFKTHEECDELINRSKKLIEEQDFNNQQSVFDTVSQSHNDDNYFLESGDKIRFFFEEKANLDEENVKNNKQYIVNKIGHALHDLDDKFIAFSRNEQLDQIARAIGFHDPLLLQSMYIFKQPKIGGEVVCHQDSTFLITEPESTVGFWFALEEANRDNGCLQVASGGHKGPLRKLFKRENNQMKMEELSNKPFPETDTFVEVKKGTLVLLHGRLPHYSCENKSPNSRHAYTIHAIDGKSKYLDYNWLQRPDLKLKGFKND